MAIFQCKMCGANLNVTSRTQLVVCEYCGTTQSPFDGQATSGGTEETFLKRAFMALGDGDFEQADSFCEQVLNINPENAQAYLCKLRAELRLQVWDDLKNRLILIHINPNYEKIMQFADEPLKNEMRKVSEWNKELIYTQVKGWMNQRLANHTTIVQALHALGSYKDCEQLLKEQNEYYLKTSERADKGCLGTVLIVCLIVIILVICMELSIQ